MTTLKTGRRFRQHSNNQTRTGICHMEGVGDHTGDTWRETAQVERLRMLLGGELWWCDNNGLGGYKGGNPHRTKESGNLAAWAGHGEQCTRTTRDVRSLSWVSLDCRHSFRSVFPYMRQNQLCVNQSTWSHPRTGHYLPVGD